MYVVDNAVIMAAGTSSRFAPLSYEIPKALITVKGEVLIERQIRQLKEAGIPEIYIVTGYKAEQFSYLEEKFGVHLVHNPFYRTRNNNSSIYAVKDILGNSYICSADNYFTENPFESKVSECYYSAIYAEGQTNEWCMETEADGTICGVKIGGSDAWYMLGHAFWSSDFTKTFLKILEAEYHLPKTANLLWESIYVANIESLKMKIRKYPSSVIFEFDTLDELREFDNSYKTDSRSMILKDAAAQLGASESELTKITAYKDTSNEAAGFTFEYKENSYRYSYNEKISEMISNG